MYVCTFSCSCKCVNASVEAADPNIECTQPASVTGWQYTAFTVQGSAVNSLLKLRTVSGIQTMQYACYVYGECCLHARTDDAMRCRTEMHAMLKYDKDCDIVYLCN